MDCNGERLRGSSAESDSADIKQTLLRKGIPNDISLFIQDQILSKRITIEDITDKVISLINELDTSDYRYQCMEEFANTDLSRVVNKSALLSNIVQRKLKTLDANSKDDKSLRSSNVPDINKILEDTGYSYETTPSYRRYGPPPDETQTSSGCDVYVGRIPLNLNEASIIPLFSKIGKIWDLRYMLNPYDGTSRGYCFIQYCNKDDAYKAVESLNGYEISKGNMISVSLSRANTKLFIGNIPKYKDANDIKAKLSAIVDGISKVIIYPPSDLNDSRKNRGYCFAIFDSQRSASVAKKKLGSSRVHLYGRSITIEWAEDRSDDDVLEKSKTLHVKGVADTVEEDDIKDAFLPYGEVISVKKVQDYAFVNFTTHEEATNALEAMDNQKLAERTIQVAFARPWKAKRKDHRRPDNGSRMHHRSKSPYRRYRSRSPLILNYKRYRRHSRSRSSSLYEKMRSHHKQLKSTVHRPHTTLRYESSLHKSTSLSRRQQRPFTSVYR